MPMSPKKFQITNSRGIEIRNLESEICNLRMKHLEDTEVWQTARALARNICGLINTTS